MDMWSRLLFRNISEPCGSTLRVGRDFWVDGKGRGSSFNMLLTPEEFHRWYNAVKDRGRAWVSVCYYALEVGERGNMECRPSFFDLIAYDFDIPLPKEECVRLREEDSKRFNGLLAGVRAEALRLYWHLSKRFNCTPMLLFTGNRGYQLWLQLDKPLPALYYRMAFHYYLTGLTFDGRMDRNVADPARLIRLPYTKHENGGLALPLDPETSTPLKLEEAVSRLKPASVSMLEELANIKPLEKPKRMVIGMKKATGVFKIRPCIQEALNNRLDGGNGHMMRLAVAVEFLNRGYTVEEVVPLFQSQLDFKPGKTRYFVEKAKEKGYKPFKCSTIRRLGFCIGESCPCFRTDLRGACSSKSDPIDTVIDLGVGLESLGCSVRGSRGVVTRGIDGSG
ncbi:hypothetical protein KEJ27_08550 [Candidatus Bathyarchaeota archaeon]|nr:hypothetical protein [Candidatus Bathyarchaeota archaeon]